MFLQQIINGITVGLVYSLMGLGFSLVWATAQTINFSQGATYSLGGYAVYTILVVLLGGFIAKLSAGGVTALTVVLFVTVASAIIGAIAGAVTEKYYFRPLREAPELAPLLGSLGIGLAIFNTVMLIWGTRYKGIPELLPAGGLSLGQAHISYVQITIIIITFMLVLVIQSILKNTKIGKAMRATSWDLRAAKLMGINTDQVILVAFIMATSLSSVGGLLVALYYGSISPFMGYSVAIKGLAAAVLGGFGNPMGAIVGGISLGILEALGAAYIASDWKDFVAYSVMIIVIVFFPSGLFGRNKSEAL